MTLLALCSVSEDCPQREDCPRADHSTDPNQTWIAGEPGWDCPFGPSGDIQGDGGGE